MWSFLNGMMAYLGFICLTIPFAVAQQNNTSSLAPDSAATESAHSVFFSAIPKNGSSGELKAADLEIREDGKPVDVSAVKRLGRLPVHFCVLFDVSGSEADRFQLQRQQAAEVLSRVITTGTDHGSVVIFNDIWRQSTETSDPQQLNAIIQQFAAHGGTALYDAMAGCAAKMESAPVTEKPELRTMFLFTDGVDDASQITNQQAADAVVKSGVRIYAFSPNYDDRTGSRKLSRFAELTGGRFFFAQDKKSLDKAIAQISNDLNNTEEAIFIPKVTSDHPDHKLELKLKSRDFSLLAPQRYAP